MQHLYHEQTNTISSTSTSSCSSKHSKSNDTTTTISSPPHLSNPSQLATTSAILFYRNPHVAGDSIDYHVYETIPSENNTYTVCTTHSAFKPVVQSNSHTIRPYLPRTNILYHHPDSSKHPYDVLAPNATVVMPICCHHYSTECSAGTLRQHVLPSTAEVYARSESIV
jgi:hypothetical protein